MLNILSVEHKTIYRYRRPVTFGVHRLMLRPRDGHDLRLLALALEISPAHALRWTYDVSGNAIASVSFTEAASELRFVGRLTIERCASRLPRSEVEAHAAGYPFAYTAQERLDLGHMLDRHYPDPQNQVSDWARSFVLGPSTGTLALLGDLNAGVQARIGYQSREAEGTQTPVETLQRGWGSCRDLAVLLAEAARSLGFGAQLVTGYLHIPATAASELPSRGAETTHAWTEVFLPGPGWVAFDPTNGTVGGENLIRVAVARDIHQIVPVAGSFHGVPEDYLGIEVEVSVRSGEPGASAG